ncbi:hypothetical protein QCA50_001138 [Cerrena zonata]|uniref:Rab proteins geranylgeranyltransferase component n=1 Tax=Cerrena zonata TaxID=2478898 RepID=A0AAW0H0T0_9APHY
MDFDTIVLGSGLTESILAAALSKAGFKVGHFDTNPYYGGDDTSLSVDDLREWSQSRNQEGNTPYSRSQYQKFSHISFTSSDVSQSRTFSISLSPTIIPSLGPLIDSLISSGVSRYGGFKLLESIAVYDGPSKVKPVPTSKEDVFRDKDLSLVEKRRLMRFLMFAAGEFENASELSGLESHPFLEFLREKFSLVNKVAQAIAYALAFCTSPSDTTLPALQRIRRYLRSAGRYGPSPFLVGHYGGIGEIAQGFCRAAAVGGATYILGRDILSLQPPSAAKNPDALWSIQIDDFEEQPQPKAPIIVTKPDYSPPANEAPSPQGFVKKLARCIVVINHSISFSPTSTPATANEEILVQAEEVPTSNIVDTGLLIFPPSSVDGGSADAAVTCLISGEGSFAAAAGHWVLHITIPILVEDTNVEPEAVLKPYLEAALTLTSSSSDEPTEPLMTLYYLQTIPAADLVVLSDDSGSFTVASDTPYIAEVGDSAATHAEEAFFKIVKALEKRGVKPSKVKKLGQESDVEEDEGPITQFWPPFDSVGDPDE